MLPYSAVSVNQPECQSSHPWYATVRNGLQSANTASGDKKIKPRMELTMRSLSDAYMGPAAHTQLLKSSDIDVT